MKTCIIYHNARCSKSREALACLQNNGIHPTIIEYLKRPLSLTEVCELRSKFELQDFIRTNEPLFKQLKLSLENESQALEAVAKEPILMQRPIVIYDGKAVIARPSEVILKLIRCD